MAFDYQQKLFDDAEVYEHLVGPYIDELMRLFACSPEGRQYEREWDEVGYTPLILDLALNYEDTTLALMRPCDLESLMFSTVPRKVTMDPEDGPALVAELDAFFEFTKREFKAVNADECLAWLRDSENLEAFEEELGDSSNFGMAKSFFAMGDEAGYDMQSREGLDQFLMAVNSGMLDDPGPPGTERRQKQDLVWAQLGESAFPSRPCQTSRDQEETKETPGES